MPTEGTGPGSRHDIQDAGTSRLLCVLAWIVGLGVGVYAGIFSFIPITGSVIAGLAARKLFSADRRFIVPAFAVQAGHLIWFCAGVIFAGAAGKSVLLDVAVLVVGLIWLAAAPSLGPIAALAAFQAFATWISADALLASEWGSISHKALLVHLSLRFLALIYLGYAALVLFERRRLGHEA